MAHVAEKALGPLRAELGPAAGSSEEAEHSSGPGTAFKQQPGWAKDESTQL